MNPEQGQGECIPCTGESFHNNPGGVECTVCGENSVKVRLEEGDGFECHRKCPSGDYPVMGADGVFTGTCLRCPKVSLNLIAHPILSISALCLFFLSSFVCCDSLLTVWAVDADHWYRQGLICDMDGIFAQENYYAVRVVETGLIYSYPCQPGHCHSAQSAACADQVSLQDANVVWRFGLFSSPELLFLVFETSCQMAECSTGFLPNPDTSWMSLKPIPANLRGLVSEDDTDAEDDGNDSVYGQMLVCCGPNRECPAENVLCGECIPGTYEWSGECVECDSEGRTAGLLILMLLGSIAFMLLFYRLSQSSTGHTKIFM